MKPQPNTSFQQKCKTWKAMNNLYISKYIDRQYNEQKKIEKVKNKSVHVLIDGSNRCFSGK